MMFFEQEQQFAQQVTFAEGVQAILKTQVAGEEIMHQPTGEPGNDTGGLDGFFAALLVRE